MVTKWIWILMSVMALSTLWELRPVSAQEKRQTYMLQEMLKTDGSRESNSSLSSNRTPDSNKMLESSTATAGPEKPRLTGVRFLSSESYTRVMLEVSRQVRYESHRLPADPAKGLPPRIYIDVFGANLGMDGKEPIKVHDGLLGQIRIGQFSPDVVRAVLDLTSVKDHNVFQLADPYRIVIDIQGQKKTETLASVEPSKPVPSPSPIEPGKRNTPAVKEVKPPLAGIRKIVLDPGHGGKDPGAIGVDGVAEKDIVLTVAKKLAAKLRKDLGVAVVLTRKDDRFVPLEDRTAIANAEDADLFISLHMNASTSGEAKGLETYYLDNTSDEASIRLAARENGTSRKNISDLQFILSDMTQNMKLEDSVTLAHRVHDSLVSSMSQKFGEVKDLGVKKALFYVLVGARMPSVLVEMFFITNKAEGRAMSREDYQNAVVEALYGGIEKYNENVLAGKTL
ncbi:MAG TPA: N-acetylmuramoyl-L-alanine amidase [Methylomirabilota bacterium]|nr:N-acetylmuramoyl-L-alanine amidase [Methylomirabilota bacterium]